MAKKENQKVMPIEEVIEKIGMAVDDLKYDVEKAKSPRRKRELKRSVHFFSSVHHHLTSIKDK
ncbi:hypothetical protein [Spongiimicrobium salis]|uniref:hypothetical protein n=1 Tax=Spongiimicrobium salis TaxID=1667022 RepID=UPI00374D6994